MPCEHSNARCINSRTRGGFRYRRRKCDDCGVRFTTIEITLHDGRVHPGKNFWESAKEQIVEDTTGLTIKQIESIAVAVKKLR